MAEKKDTSSNLPAVLPTGYGVAAVELPENSRTPYVAFVYAKTKGYSGFLQKIPDLLEGEPVLVLPSPASPRVQRPFRFFLLSSAQFWAEYNKSTGQMIRSVPYREKDPFKETIEALILVITDEGLVPAQVRFKATTCPGVYSAVRATAEAQTEEWGKKSQDHKFTANPKIPHWARFTTRSHRITRQKRDGEGSYPTMESVSNPTTAADLQALVEFFQNDENKALLKEVEQVYAARLAEAKKKQEVK